MLMTSVMQCEVFRCSLRCCSRFLLTRCTMVPLSVVKLLGNHERSYILIQQRVLGHLFSAATTDDSKCRFKIGLRASTEHGHSKLSVCNATRLRSDDLMPFLQTPYVWPWVNHYWLGFWTAMMYVMIIFYTAVAQGKLQQAAFTTVSDIMHVQFSTTGAVCLLQVLVV